VTADRQREHVTHEVFEANCWSQDMEAWAARQGPIVQLSIAA
jgi:hypothetical protein